MGGDGGVHCKERKYMVAMRKDAVNPSDPKELMRVKWTTCHATANPLRAPLVFCDLGFIYNKEDLLQALLTKTLSPKLGHIRKLKDVYPLVMQENPDYDKSLGAASSDTVGRWVCAVSGVSAGTGKPFCVLRTCGHAFSERALKELADSTCPTCSLAFTPQDTVPLNGTTEQVQQLKEAMEARRSLEPEPEKKKKRKKHGDADGAGAGGGAGAKKANKSLAGAAATQDKVSLDTAVAASRVGDAHEKAKSDPVYASIFRKKGQKDDETFACRSVSNIRC